MMAIPHRVPLGDLRSFVGTELGPGAAIHVTQDMIDAFADATGDDQWIHVDPERSRRGPYGTTIAHGFLTLSLVPVLVRTVLVVDGVGRSVNYGLDRVRFPAPAPVDCQLQATVQPMTAEQTAGGGVQLHNRVTVSEPAAEKPCCVADTIVRYYPQG